MHLRIIVSSFCAATKGAHVDGAFTIPRDRDGSHSANRCASITGGRVPASDVTRLQQPRASNTISTCQSHSAPPLCLLQPLLLPGWLQSPGPTPAKPALSSGPVRVSRTTSRAPLWSCLLVRRSITITIPSYHSYSSSQYLTTPSLQFGKYLPICNIRNQISMVHESCLLLMYVACQSRIRATDVCWPTYQHCYPHLIPSQILWICHQSGAFRVLPSRGPALSFSRSALVPVLGAQRGLEVFAADCHGRRAELGLQVVGFSCALDAYAG